MMLVPIWTILQIYYNVSTYEMNWMSNWLYICPLVLSSFWNYLILKHYGISQILSALFTAIGSWIAWMAGENFTMAQYGALLIGFGYSLFCQVPLYLSKLWFEPEERIISTFIAQYSNNAGNLFGYIFSSLYFYGLDDWEIVIARIGQLFYIQAIISSVSLAISFISLITPPDSNSQIQSRENLWNSFKKIFNSYESIFDLFSAGSIVAFCWIYPSLIAIQQYLLNEDNLNIFANSISFQIIAMLVAAYCSIRLDKQSKRGLQQNYDSYIKFQIIIGCSSLILELLFLEQLSPIMLIIINCVIGAGLNSVYSLLLESLQEKHFPVAELAIGTVIVDFGCFIGLLFIFILSLDTIIAFSFQISCFFLIPSFCYFIVFYKTKFNRFEFEA